MRPTLRGEKLLGGVLAEAPGSVVEHPFLFRGRRPGFAAEAFDRRIAVGVDQRRKGLDEVKGGAVESRAVRRVNVDARTPSPALAARDQLHLDHALRAEQHAHVAIRILARGRHHDPDRLLQRGRDVGVLNDLAEVR